MVSSPSYIPSFVVHHHSALKAGLHHDLRLEFEGVLKSWAIPKTLNELEAGVRRLAIEVEDHSMDHLGFSGEILDGYGAGVVEIWDSGVYETIKRNEDVWVIRLGGERLRGIFVLQKMEGKKWLLFKKKTPEKRL